MLRPSMILTLLVLIKILTVLLTERKLRVCSCHRISLQPHWHTSGERRGREREGESNREGGRGREGEGERGREREGEIERMFFCIFAFSFLPFSCLFDLCLDPSFSFLHCVSLPHSLPLPTLSLSLLSLSPFLSLPLSPLLQEIM